jgi:hypothetical protein
MTAGYRRLDFFNDLVHGTHCRRAQILEPGVGSTQSDENIPVSVLSHQLQIALRRVPQLSLQAFAHSYLIGD